jgi:dethiobiotin synthetase
VGSVRGLFVTGTDTGVGKTVVSASILASMRAAGLRPTPCKPFLTGLQEPADPDWPHDHRLLALAAGGTVDDAAADRVALRRFDPPLSPHLAAELAGRPLDVEQVLREVTALVDERPPVVVEGVGGLLVPLGDGWDVRRFAAALGLAVVLVARPGLGTINHTLLSLEAARSAGLEVRAVVLDPWPERPELIERSNLETIEELGGVQVTTLPWLPRADPELLAHAGSRLPWRDWLA